MCLGWEEGEMRGEHAQNGAGVPWRLPVSPHQGLCSEAHVLLTAALGGRSPHHN